MKISLTLALLATVGSTTAFTPAARSTATTSSSALHAVEQSRQDFFKQAAAMAGFAAAMPSPAFAAKYGGFGAGSPEVLDPSEADVDSDILASSSVQEALKKVKGYKGVVQKMEAALKSDPQANLRSFILKELDFSGLRTDLNTVNSAFEEDTQRGTDRLIRVIMQDITELEIANNQKDGVERSARRYDNLMAKLAKLDQAFDDYLAFTK